MAKTAQEKFADDVAGKRETKEETKGKTDTKGKGKTKTGSSNPRPRKWNYGISPGATIRRAKEDNDVTLRGDLVGDYTLTADTPTVAVYTEAGGSRAGLRRLSRKKLITIKGEDGGVYPKEYTAPAD